MKKQKQLFSWLLIAILVMGSVFSQTNLSHAAGKKMKVSKSKLTLQPGKSKTLKVKNAPKKAKITWKSKNPKIAKVNQKGKVTAKKKGNTKVICKVAYQKSGKKKSKKFVISVRVKAIPKQTASPVSKASSIPKVSAAPQRPVTPSASTIPQVSAMPSASVMPSASATPKATPVPMKSSTATFRDLSSDELIQEMGAGWNLGNTMDGHTGFTPGETIWQPYKTTKQLMKSIHDMGFNTVRIPVTWGTMIDDENNYAIDEKWMSRVQDIVDYCIAEDMYVIVNVHHDGAEQTGWLRIATDDQKALEEKFAAVWNNIASSFRDYDEHLILESMNEVRGENMTVAEENAVIMKLNQIFVNTVRGTGSNNAKRWLMMPGKYNFIDSVCNEKHGFTLPEDSISNRLIVSIHDYSPWSFCGQESSSGAECTEKMLSSNDKELQPLYDKYTSKGIPVVVGEYGCINKNNKEDRAYYLEAMNRMFRKYKLVGVYWDQGWFDRSQQPADYSFSIINRASGEPIDEMVSDALLRGILGLDGATDPLALSKNPEIIPLTEITLPVEKADLKVNETLSITAAYAPANSNDVLLWKTENPSVATVYKGKIIARGIGTTTITAYSQHSAVSAQLPVTVTAAAAEHPCEEIHTDADSYQLTEDAIAWLGTDLSPEVCEESIYYYSADESVATVSSVGKIVAVGVGETMLTVGTSGGKSKSIPVTVSKKVAEKAISLAVNVYYNDSANNYYANEESKQVLTVDQDGQYTLSFDCAADLSEKAKQAGVDSLNHVTAIYIKDHAVTAGDASDSPLSACKIRYDEITVDGTKLTITKNDFKSALKSSGIFDTNDPINGWDGSAVEEVKTSGNSVSFNSISNPKKITITFTLEGMQFKQ